jgi:hypothetical protein
MQRISALLGINIDLSGDDENVSDSIHVHHESDPNNLIIIADFRIPRPLEVKAVNASIDPLWTTARN